MTCADLLAAPRWFNQSSSPSRLSPPSYTVNTSINRRTTALTCHSTRAPPLAHPNAHEQSSPFRPSGDSICFRSAHFPSSTDSAAPAIRIHSRHRRAAVKCHAAVSTNTRTARAEDGGREDEATAGDSFDASAPPPFTLSDLRNAIPAHCWVKDTGRSLAYLAADVAIVAGLAVAAYAADSWAVWPLYWFAQGVMLTTLFIIGHDCNHGSFSNSKLLNDVIGHLTHTPVLTPFHGWRISHRTHHSNHGHVENDESWHPTPKDFYDNMFWWKVVRYQFPIPIFAFPFYLWVRSPGKAGSHYLPSSDLFQPKEARDVILSSTCWLIMLAALVCLTVQSPVTMLKLYWVPYLNFIAWLAGITYLHHHAHHEKLPWYRGKEWSYLRGALTTVDRDYGIIKVFHHDIGTHVVHHLFPQIPHYHLIEATEAVKPVLGKYYREPEPCKWVLPFHLIPPMLKSFSQDHYVPSKGDVVYYEKDESIRAWWWWG